MATLKPSRSFECVACAAAPHLQDLQGCFKPLPRPIAVIGGVQFDRCPTALQNSRSALVVRMVVNEFMKFSSYKERSAMPAKLMQGIQYLTLMGANDGD